jgi:hypothetical protein
MLKKLSQKRRLEIQDEINGVIRLKEFWEVNLNSKQSGSHANLKIQQCDTKIAELSAQL